MLTAASSLASQFALEVRHSLFAVSGYAVDPDDTPANSPPCESGLRQLIQDTCLSEREITFPKMPLANARASRRLDLVVGNELSEADEPCIHLGGHVAKTHRIDAA